MQDRPNKNKRTALILACLPWGIFTYLYTYKKDRARFFKNLRSVILWTALTLLALILPDIDSIQQWLTERNLETEITQLVLLICLAGLTILIMLEGWLHALRKTLKRSNSWYRQYPNSDAKKP